MSQCLKCKNERQKCLLMMWSFIVCPPAPIGVTTSFGYEWSYAFEDQYEIMEHSGSQEMVEDFGEIFLRCMSLCLGRMVIHNTHLLSFSIISK